jgi:hypothetical protein
MDILDILSPNYQLCPWSRRLITQSMSPASSAQVIPRLERYVTLRYSGLVSAAYFRTVTRRLGRYVM